MEYYFENDRPIYLQLMDKIRTEIVSGKYSHGERLPSVRELAMQFRVNPNTMQKALSELEDEGLVYTERTNGKFVTTDIELINKVKNSLTKFYLNLFLKEMNNIGLTKKEVIKCLQEMEDIQNGIA